MFQYFSTVPYGHFENLGRGKIKQTSGAYSPNPKPLNKSLYIYIMKKEPYRRVDECLDDVMVFGQHGSLVKLRPNNHTKCGSNMDDLG